MEAPRNDWPLPSTTRPGKNRLWVLAATVVIHGTLAGPPMVLKPLPLLPADVATNTPASAANRKARSSGPVRPAPPPIE